MIQKAHEKCIRLVRAAKSGAKDYPDPMTILVRYLQAAILDGLNTGGHSQAGQPTQPAVKTRGHKVLCLETLYLRPEIAGVLVGIKPLDWCYARGSFKQLVPIG
jgi:hypothetical protein